MHRSCYLQMKSKNKKSLWFVYTLKGDAANYKQCTRCGKITYIGGRGEKIYITKYCAHCGKEYATDVVEYYSYVKGGPILIEKI